MDSEFRRLIAALVVATGVFFAYQLTVRYLFPPPPTPPATASAPGGPPAMPAVQPPAAQPVAPLAPAATAPSTTPTAPSLDKGALPYVASSLEDARSHVLGGRDGDALRIELSPAGASVSTLALTARKPNGRYVHRRTIRDEEPFVLVAPVSVGPRDYHSFDTQRVRVVELNQAFDLDRAIWKLESATAEEAVFTSVLRDGEDRDLLRFRKTYALRDGKPIFTIRLEIENAGSQPLTVSIDQDGPMGMAEVDPAHDTRLLMSAQYDKANAALELNRAYYHKELTAAVAKGEPVKLMMPDKGRLAWVVLSNKYFGIYLRPLPTDSANAGYVASVMGLVADPSATVNAGDMLARLATYPVAVAPGATARYAFEVYAGAKDRGSIERVDSALAEENGLNYPLAQSADRRCSCTFRWIENLMVWLLEIIFAVVRNYGVAIIVLVIIVRGLLHPLSVWQQKSMYRMQEAMSRVQPKIDEIKEKYANDKVKLNQEMMKVFAEENVNPAGSMVAMVPLFLQMPILVALWTTLNTDVNLRHAPFDGWWITDLSAPDAFIHFASPVDVPVLSAIPLIGWIFTGVRSINILPILMGVSMWLQQKYMPKPHLKAKLEAARQQPPRQRKAGGLTPEEQMRQQQIMSYMMSIMFPLMFYSMPSGLNLYWMATNIFGICESLIIQRQLEEERKRKELLGPQPRKPKKDGVMSRFFRKIAAQAEELQKKADELSRQEEARKAREREARKGGGKS